jgi:hypothetical protein
LFGKSGVPGGSEPDVGREGRGWSARDGLAGRNAEAVDGCAAEKSELFIGPEAADEVVDAPLNRLFRIQEC